MKVLACESGWARISTIDEGVDERGVEGMRVDEDVMVVRWPQTVFSSRSSCTWTSRVESKAKTWPWIVTLGLPFRWALEDVDVCIYMSMMSVSHQQRRKSGK